MLKDFFVQVHFLHKRARPKVVGRKIEEICIIKKSAPDHWSALIKNLKTG